jgi:hypothetical protein
MFETTIDEIVCRMNHRKLVEELFITHSTTGFLVTIIPSIVSHDDEIKTVKFTLRRLLTG